MTPPATTELPHRSADRDSLSETVIAKVEELRLLVANGQRRWKKLILLEAIGLAVAAPLAYLWLVFLIDNVVHLPVWGRLLAILLFIVAIVWTAYRLYASWRRARFTEDQVALAMESRTPGGLQNRLINAIQLARDSDTNAPMSRAVVEENYGFLRQVRVEQSSNRWPAIARITAASLVVILGLGFWIFSRERFTNAASRIFMPFSDIAPLYQTRLIVEPGDVNAGNGDNVTITIHIDGRVPEELVLLTRQGGEQSSRAIAVNREDRTIQYTLDSIQRSLTYAVRGGDFTSRYYQVNVPSPLLVEQLQATYRFPSYTRLPERQFAATSGDLEAVRGTHANLNFVLNEPADEAWMLIESAPANSPNATSAPQRVSLKKIADAQFATEIDFQNVAGYRLEARRGSAEPIQSARHDLHVLDDKAPDLTLGGIDPDSQVMVDALVPLHINANDDFGVKQVGLFYRKLTQAPATTQPASTAPSNASASASSAEWLPLQVWPVNDNAATFSVDIPFSAAAVGLVEGDVIELVLRAQDTDPAKANLWTTGSTYRVTATSEDAALQLTYEKILRTEADLQHLLDAHKDQIKAANDWLAKLGPGSGLRWDDTKNLDALAEAMKSQAKTQSDLRQRTTQAARDMVPEAGTLQLSVGMLADTELVRAIRILEAVPTRDTPQDKTSALSDARLTEERIVRSLGEMFDHYVDFRKDWEMAHMVAFTQMLAERQQRMADASGTYATLDATATTDPQKQSASRRQLKVLELSNLAQTALVGMSQRSETIGPILVVAFKNAADAFDSTGVKTLFTQASQSIDAGDWTATQQKQRAAADILATIVSDLRKAQAEAAQLAMAEMQKLADADKEAAQRLKQLKAGSGDSLINADEKKLTVADVIAMRDNADRERQRAKNAKDLLNDSKFEKWMIDLISKSAKTPEQDISILQLAKKPGAQASFPNFSDLEGNKVEAGLKDSLKDLVGDLLNEADDMRDDYETLNLNVAWGPKDPGIVEKSGGSMNSTGAMATTGNQKPPTNNVGGVSGSGRQGARAHGLVAGSESVNRKGRDEVQEGQERAPDQAGVLKQQNSADMQADASTGVGGKVVDAPKTSFSTKDAGQWTDDIADRMRAPQAENQIVERKGAPLDPNIAALLRDTRSRQEQLITRIKAVKKEYDRLYLPTEELDEIAAKLAANMDRMKESPDADVFRQQVELLDQLQGVFVVFDAPTGQYEQSLPREQATRGSILDEPNRPATPGYEEAVQWYYQNLANGGSPQ